MAHPDERTASDLVIGEWREQKKKALRLIKLVGDLRFDRSIEILIFRRSIYDARPTEVLQHHRVSKNYFDEPLLIDTSLQITEVIMGLEELGPSRIDIGILSSEWLSNGKGRSTLVDFVSDRLRRIIDNGRMHIESADVVLYGFGRIGRLLARRILELTGRGDQLRLKAIVLRPQLADLRTEIEKRMALLMEDSVHGPFHGLVDISGDGRTILINGNRVSIIFARTPDEIDYTLHGIRDALLIDNTGVWRDLKGLSQHLRPGIAKVLLTAPGKDVPNLVHGVNQSSVDLDNDKVLSAASCTTNAIVPIIHVLESHLGIAHGHVETIHAYTSDQNLLDNFHKKPRRGRAAAINMVLTSTGAASAIAKILPHLSGKFTGNAVRVPTPNVSLAIISVGLKRQTTADEVNSILRDAAMRGPLVEQIHYSTSDEYVSSHAVGMTTTSVLDAPSTLVSPDGHNVIIYAWYDNEYGYACQVVRLAKYLCGVRRPTYY